MLLPESVADDNNWRNPALEIRAPDSATQLWRHAKQRKKVCSYLRPFDMLGHIAAGQIGVPSADGGKLTELRALFTPVAKIRGSRTQVVVISAWAPFPRR